MAGPLPFTHVTRVGSLPQLIRTLPQRQLIYFWMAIFSTFSMIGFVLDILTRGRQPAVLLALNVIFSGLLSVGYAMASIPMRRWPYAAMLAVHMTYVVVVPRFFALYEAAPPGRLTLDAVGTLATVAIGYSCFLRFISVTATRYVRAQAEIALARDIHQVLVPPVERRIGDFEFFGWSVASGDVGGDLVDIVEQDGAWLGYVADVSGHGVGPGVVMGMFKSALRMRVRTGGSIGALLDDVHAVLMPLKRSNTFVTVACVRGGACDQVECAVAGHLPILRARNGVGPLRAVDRRPDRSIRRRSPGARTRLGQRRAGIERSAAAPGHCRSRACRCACAWQATRRSDAAVDSADSPERDVRLKSDTTYDRPDVRLKADTTYDRQT